MKRTAFFISDGTGLTAEALGHALLAQFEKIEFERVTVPYIDDEEKARDLVSRINKASNDRSRLRTSGSGADHRAHEGPDQSPGLCVTYRSRSVDQSAGFSALRRP